MIHEKINVANSDSADYVALNVYIQEYSESIGIRKRPMVIICPGGGYAWTSDREAEPIALSFMAKGYHTAVLRYSTAPIAHFPTALKELALAVKTIRENAEGWHVDPNKIIVCGGSAGGHLAASLACFYNRDFLRDIGDIEEIKPNGLLLLYPVITMGEFCHQGSKENLFGTLTDAKAFGGDDLTEYLSLENQVSEAVPPCFIWATYEDESVPVENTLLFVNALRKAKVSTELHIFPHGGHGLSLANGLSAGPEKGRGQWQPEVAQWIDLANTWLGVHFPIDYAY